MLSLDCIEAYSRRASLINYCFLLGVLLKNNFLPPLRILTRDSEESLIAITTYVVTCGGVDPFDQKMSGRREIAHVGVKLLSTTWKNLVSNLEDEPKIRVLIGVCTSYR